MHLPPEAIHEFRAIWLAEYGEELPFEQARLVAERFLSGVRLMLTVRPEPDPSTDQSLTGPNDGGVVTP